jgi:hypothetical protein
MGAAVATNSAPELNFQPGNYRPGKLLPGNQQPKYAFVALPLSYGYLSDRQDSNLQLTN